MHRLAAGALVALVALGAISASSQAVRRPPPSPPAQHLGPGSWTCKASARSLAHPHRLTGFTANGQTRADATDKALNKCRTSHRVNGGTCRVGDCRQRPM